VVLEEPAGCAAAAATGLPGFRERGILDRAQRPTFVNNFDARRSEWRTGH